MKLDNNSAFAAGSESERPPSQGLEPSVVTLRYLPASLFPITVVLAAGFVGSFLPYILWWYKTGHFSYVADKDNQYYLQLAARLYFLKPFSMSDPVLLHGVTIYQPLQFVPAVLIVRILGLPVLAVNAVWHLWAALALPVTLYLVFFQFLRQPWAAASCSLVILFDAGVITAQPLVFQLTRLFQAVLGHLPVFYDGQELIGQWRVVDPAVGLPLLLLQIFFVGAALARPKDRRLPIAAGILTALLIYTWFYFWTAVAGALAIAFVVDHSARWMYGKILVIGVIAGLPAIVYGFTIRPLLDPDALHRIGLFAKVPRLDFFILPKAALLALMVSGIWIWLKPNREGLYLWCLALAALMLSNNHLATGMDLRAGHWRYVWGPSLSILLLLMVVQLLLKGARLPRGAVAVAAAATILFELSAGGALRAMEVNRSLNTTFILNGYMRFISQASFKVPPSLPPNAVIAGDDEYCDLASIFSGVRPLAGYAAFLSLGIGDRAWESREALNAYLEGLNEEDFRLKANALSSNYGWGQSADPLVGARVIAGMMREFSKMKSDPLSGIKAFGVRYVALSVAQSDPPYLKRGWTLFDAGPSYRVWRKDQ